MPILPIAGLEVSRLHIRPHTFELLRMRSSIASAVMDVLYVYQNANDAETFPYPFILKVDKVTRAQALVLMTILSGEIVYAQNNHNFGYAIDWWWRTPSSAGEGEVRIGMRVCGICEMIR